MASRRGHGEGSIYKDADGRWRGTLDLGWQGSKRRRKYVSGKTRKEIDALLDQARRLHEQGALTIGPQQTVWEFLDAWLTDTARHRLRPTTYRRYRKLLAVAAGDPLEALYVVALMTGMRQGELLGLQWADVD